MIIEKGNWTQDFETRLNVGLDLNLLMPLKCLVLKLYWMDYMYVEYKGSLYEIMSHDKILFQVINPIPQKII